MRTGTFTGTAPTNLHEFDEWPADPLELAREWLRRAESYVAEPSAMAIATATSDGIPSNRVVTAKEIDDRGVVFTTDVRTTKGAELAGNPQAACTFYWRETLQQLHVRGPVEPLDEASTRRLFGERPRLAQAVSIVSVPGAPLVDEAEVRQRAIALAESDRQLERPPTWQAARVIAQYVEFWVGDPSRLHRRLAYEWIDGQWAGRRLQP